MSAILDAVRESYYDLYEAGLVTKEDIMNKAFMEEDDWDLIEPNLGDDQGLDFLG